MSEKELESKCREIRQLQSLIAQAEQEMEALKDSIKAHIGDAEEVFADLSVWQGIQAVLEKINASAAA